MPKKIRMGMIGGGPGAFIGEVHRRAARLDGQVEIVAGAFSIVPDESTQMGQLLGIDPKRAYKTYQDMIRGESQLPPDQRVDFVSVCTPNNYHFSISRDFLEAGFHVVCEKPMTMTLEEAISLRGVVQKTGKCFGLMHTYTGYPMVKLARDMAKQNDLGKIRKVVVEYPQGWLAKPIEREGQMQASWRTDPKQSGVAGCMGDIGTHAANLAEYVTGLKIKELLGDLTTFVQGRPLDDDGSVLLRLENGAKGVLHASQISVGEENDLAIWVYGEKASLEWQQKNPNYLYFRPYNAPEQIWGRGNAYVGEKSKAAAKATRTPGGHPEGYIEAFANHYANFVEQIKAMKDGRHAEPVYMDLPNVEDGIRGMAFIESVVKSSREGGVWVKIPV
ncbi:MAG: Gfo/Idh/MocA family oxidoreductase [Pseudomonadota bacterium]